VRHQTGTWGSEGFQASVRQRARRVTGSGWGTRTGSAANTVIDTPLPLDTFSTRCLTLLWHYCGLLICYRLIPAVNHAGFPPPRKLPRWYARDGPIHLSKSRDTLAYRTYRKGA
jgi:hypothetical protein